MTDKEISQLREKAITSLKQKNPGKYFGPQDIFKEMQRLEKPEDFDMLKDLFKGIFNPR